MAGIRWLETDTLSNQNISSPLGVGAYTANGDRAIMVQVFVDQAAGNGDYVMHATLQIGGAGSAYVILPKTTMTAASGETAIAGQSGWINVRNGDVVTVYVDGLAGDTTTPDTIVRWFEDAALQPATADRTLNVAADGDIGGNVDGTVASVTAGVTLADDAITAAKIAADAVTEIQSGLATTTNVSAVETDTQDIQSRLPSALVAGKMDSSVAAMQASALKDFFDTNSGDDYDTAVAGSVVKEIVDNAGGGSGGATAAEVWAYGARTLTQTAAAVQAAVEGSLLTITRGDTWSATLTGLAANTGYVSIDITIKGSPEDSDDNAIIRIRKNASGTGDGLQRLNGAALVSPVVAADGSITVYSATSLTIALAARATDDLEAAKGLYYDIQYIFASSVQTATQGICNVTGDITRAIS